MKLTSLFEDIVARNGKVLVIGLGITGIEAARFLHARGASPLCVESKSWDEYRASSKYVAQCEQLKAAGVPLNFGVGAVNIRRFLKDVSLCVVSPGVPLSHPLIIEVQKKKIRTTGEFEMGVELAGIPAVIVTGSNGKSTVVTLLHEFLSAAGKQSFLCGNIGEPVISQLPGIIERARSGETGERYLVVEASSYQLESCESLKPRVAVFLNLSNNHLERHGTMEAYFEAKRNGFIRQDEGDISIINTDDPYGVRLAAGLRSRIISFGFNLPPVEGQERNDEYARIFYDRIAKVDRIQMRIEGREETYDVSAAGLTGRHTRYNICAAVVAARAMGVSSETINSVIPRFQNLPHRIERVVESGGMLFINDSKSTTVASTCAAFLTVLEYFPPREIVLMIGGQAKKTSWEPLLRLLDEQRDRLRGVVCFGRDGGMLKRELKRVKIDGVETPNLKSAVERAREMATHGDVVLLSPGCASFDEFKDFEERGDSFKRLVAG